MSFTPYLFFFFGFGGTSEAPPVASRACLCVSDAAKTDLEVSDAAKWEVTVSDDQDCC